MTLLLWKAPVVDDADAAERLVAPYYERGDDGAFEPSPAVAAVVVFLPGILLFGPKDGAR